MIRRALFTPALFAFLLLLAPSTTVLAQPSNIQRTNPEMLGMLGPVVAKASESTVRVRCSDKDVALGAIVKADGWIVTKASELKGDAVCKLKDNREFPAKVIGIHKEFDLAMLKIEATGLPVVDWRPSTEVEVGNWLVTPGTGKEPVALGVVSVNKRNLPKGSLRERPLVQPNPNGGFLGIEREEADGGVKVKRLLHESAAAKAGLKVGDLIVQIDDKVIEDFESMLEVLGKKRAGDLVTIKAVRDGQQMDFKVTLGKRPPDFIYLGINVQNAEGGVQVVAVDPSMGPGKAGLKVNDLITGVNTDKITDMESMAAKLTKFRQGDDITFKVTREGVMKELEIKFIYPRRPDPNFNRGDFQNKMGSTLSDRRTGFPTILQHDTVIKPSDCGGPIVDLDGKVIGINIARAGRTESYAIPSEVVLTLLPDLMSGKLAPVIPKGLSAAERLKAAEALKTKAQGIKTEAEKQLKEADKQLKEAEDAIKKAKADLEAEKKKDEKIPEPKKK